MKKISILLVTCLMFSLIPVISISAFSTSYEAESYYNTKTGVTVSTAKQGASGGQVITNIGDCSGTLRFNYVNVQRTGSYNLTIYYYTSTNKSFYLQINSGNFTYYTFTGTGNDQRGSMTLTLTLQAGNNTLLFDRLSDFTADIDKIDVVLTPVTKYEAESSSNDICGSAQIADKTGASGGQIVEYIGDDGPNYLRFNNVYAESAGSYQITIYYYFDVDRFGYVSVNDGSGITLNFLGKGNWTTEGTKTITLNLQAGNNTLKFYRFTDRIPDIDKIEIEDRSSTGYEAESSSNELHGAAFVDNKCAASNNQVVKNIGDETNNWLQFNYVNVPTAGTYNVIFYYYSYSPDLNKNCYLSINSGTGILQVFKAASDFKTPLIKIVPLDLQAGDNTIKFKKDFNYIYLDKIEVDASPIATPTPTAPPTKTPTATVKPLRHLLYFHQANLVKHHQFVTKHWRLFG